MYTTCTFGTLKPIFIFENVTLEYNDYHRHASLNR
jgi:hypothetical protein